jgi:hypothetical protein
MRVAAVAGSTCGIADLRVPAARARDGVTIGISNEVPQQQLGTFNSPPLGARPSDQPQHHLGGGAQRREFGGEVLQ